VTRFDDEVAYAVELMLDLIAELAEDRDDEELVDVGARLALLASACGTSYNSEGDEDLISAGELRERVLRARAALSRYGVAADGSWGFPP
jgi:hypothetical protein